MSNTSTPLDMICSTYLACSQVKYIVYRMLKLLILRSTSIVFKTHICWDNNLRKIIKGYFFKVLIF